MLVVAPDSYTAPEVPNGPQGRTQNAEKGRPYHDGAVISGPVRLPR